MSEYSDLDQLLVIDLETVSGKPDFDSLDPRLQKLWEKKVSYQLKEEQTAAELYKEKAGIMAEFGRIVCIGVGFFKQADGHWTFRAKSLVGHDEHKLLQEFSDLLKRFGHRVRLVAHNGKEFDYPYLCRRMLINNIPLPQPMQLLKAKPWENPHVDTMDLWKFGDYKSYTSLDLLAALFDIPTPKDDIDGSQVGHVYYEENDLERIGAYCAKDVVTTARVFLRLKGFPDLQEQHIQLL